MRAISILLGLLLATLASLATADTVALTSVRANGNQNWTGALGMDFDVLSSITVTQLGAFDSGQNGFANTILVGIFNRDSRALVTSAATFTSASQPLLGNSRFFDISDVTLAPGRYSIVAVGFGPTDANGNGGTGTGPSIDTGGGLLTFVGTSRWSSSTTLSFPLNLDGGTPAFYDAGTFQYVASTVPEVSRSTLTVLGLLFVAAIFRLAPRVCRSRI